MKVIANTIFCDKIFGVIMTLKFWPPCWCLYVGHQDGRFIHFLLKMSNILSPITLKRNVLVLQNLAQMCSFKFSTIQ